MHDLDAAALGLQFHWTSLCLAWAIAVVFVYLFTPVARRVGWVDKPSSRKAHQGEIPLIGGWAVLFAMLAVQIGGPLEARAPAGYWCGALLLFAVALIDDRHPIRARYRFMVHFTAAIAGISMGGQVLTSLGDLFGTGVLTGWWTMGLISVVGTVALINAVNFTDGADGLCGGLGFISLFWFIIALAISTSRAAYSGEIAEPYAQSLIPLAAAMMGGLGGFLFFNMRSRWRKRASVFMGDSGSTLVGFTLAWLAIHVTSAYASASVSPVVCLWIMAMPLADSASCIFRRSMAGVNPTVPDLKHLHHLLPQFGLTTGKSVGLIHAGSFLCGFAGVSGWWLGVADSWMFAGFAATLIAFVGATWLAWRSIDRGQARVEVTA